MNSSSAPAPTVVFIGVDKLARDAVRAALPDADIALFDRFSEYAAHALSTVEAVVLVDITALTAVTEGAPDSRPLFVTTSPPTPAMFDAASAAGVPYITVLPAGADWLRKMIARTF